MTTTPIYHGVKVHWGVGSSTAIGVSGTFVLQGRDHGMTADAEVIQDATGFAVNKTYYNHNESATFDYVPTDTYDGAGNLTPSIPTVGALVTVTDTVYTTIAGTNWLIDSISTKSSNTSAMRVTLTLSRYGLITA